MLKFLFGKDWKKSDPHLLLLSKFIRGTTPESFSERDYWQPVLNESPKKAINRLLKEGMLEPTGLSELIDYKFKASDLKQMLKERKLKITGRKSELIDRLVAADEGGMRNATKNLRLLKCSKQGKGIAESYLERERYKRSQAENEVLAALRMRDFERACAAGVEYETKQIFPRGLSIDWNDYDCSRDISFLNIIFNQIPSILNDINKECLSQLRLAAGMAHLWGTGRAKTWIPDNIQTGIRLDEEASVGMLISHALHQLNLKQYREMKVKTIEILGVNDSMSCSECRKIAGKKYKFSQLPELPYPKCTSEMGCRCTTIVADF